MTLVYQIYSRICASRGILCLLDEAGHVLQEQVVHVLLVHVLQLEALGGVALGDRVTGVVRIHHFFRLQKSNTSYRRRHLGHNL